MDSILAVACGWQSDVWRRVCTVLLVTVYTAVSMPLAFITARSFHDRSLRIESLVLGVVEQHKQQAGKTIVLKNVDMEMVRSGIVHNPFLIYGYGLAYLAPEEEDGLRSDPVYAVMKDRIISAGELSHMVAEKRAVVYDVRDERVADVTAQYR